MQTTGQKCLLSMRTMFLWFSDCLFLMWGMSLTKNRNKLDLPLHRNFLSWANYFSKKNLFLNIAHHSIITPTVYCGLFHSKEWSHALCETSTSEDITALSTEHDFIRGNSGPEEFHRWVAYVTVKTKTAKRESKSIALRTDQTLGDITHKWFPLVLK